MTIAMPRASPARLAEAKRADESKKADKAVGDTNFSKLMGKGKEEAGRTNQAQQKQQAQAKEAPPSSARSAIEHLLESKEMPGAENRAGQEKSLGQQQEASFKSRLGGKALDEKVQQGGKQDGDAAMKTKLTSDQGTAQTGAGRAADQSSSARGADAKTTRERIEERHEAGSSSEASQASATQGKGDKGELRVGADKGGGGQGGSNKDGKDGQPAMAPGFRFNPALMAPVPVAKQKEASGSERLRKVANELAQKIVEKVRVGTNAAGKAEFQIDLRSNVLSGLSVKVSVQNGKIKATFSGSDHDVLKMIEEQSDTLKNGAVGPRALARGPQDRGPHVSWTGGRSGAHHDDQGGLHSPTGGRGNPPAPPAGRQWKKFHFDGLEKVSRVHASLLKNLEWMLPNVRSTGEVSESVKGRLEGMLRGEGELKAEYGPGGAQLASCAVTWGTRPSSPFSRRCRSKTRGLLEVELGLAQHDHRPAAGRCGRGRCRCGR